jgi:hypothetical protein
MAIAVAFSAMPAEIASAETLDTTPILEVLALEKPGDHPIGVRAWYEKEPGHVFQTGDRVILSFQTDQDAHVMVLHVIPGRSVRILFPHKEHANAEVHKGAVNTLFGDDSGIRLTWGKKVPQAELVLCASSKPFELGTLKRQDDEAGVALRSAADVQTLKAILQTMAKDPGFNRLVLPCDEQAAYGFEAVLTLSPPSTPPKSRGLPGAEDSDRPGTVTGTQGIRPKANPR